MQPERVEMKGVRSHLRANVVGYLALFIALGGTGAWAAEQITSRHIAKDAVLAKHVKRNAVRTAEIRKGAVTKSKLAPTEAVRLVGTPGNPDFGVGWDNLGPSFTPTGFYKDGFGVVHLQGTLDAPGSASTIFTLPAGYRPDPSWNFNQFSVTADGNEAAIVQVDFDGAVRVLVSTVGDNVSLNGITFRAVP